MIYATSTSLLMRIYKAWARSGLGAHMWPVKHFNLARQTSNNYANSELANKKKIYEVMF